MSEHDARGWPARYVDGVRVCARAVTPMYGKENDTCHEATLGEFRIDGYCSRYCRDMADVESERDAMLRCLRNGVRANCPDCGRGVKIDEDGCCAGCGADAIEDHFDAERDALTARCERLEAALRIACAACYTHGVDRSKIAEIAAALGEGATP